MKIIVSGMVAGNPGQGGAAWAVLQYVLGLLQLGHDVYLVEPINSDQVLPLSSNLEFSKNSIEMFERIAIDHEACLSSSVSVRMSFE